MLIPRVISPIGLADHWRQVRDQENRDQIHAALPQNCLLLRRVVRHCYPPSLHTEQPPQRLSVFLPGFSPA